MPPANLLFHGVSKRTLGSWFVRQKDAVDQARAGNLLTGDASGGLLASFDKRPVEPGSEWIATRILQPTQERVHNEQLSRALVVKQSFSSAEVASFDLPVLHQKMYVVADDGAKYKPLLTTPMSKFFVLFDSIDDYVEEIVEQPDSQRFFYEIVAQRCCLYFDLECEEPPDGLRSLVETRDFLFETVRDVYKALQKFSALVSGTEQKLKVQLAESSREKRDGTKKASFHLVCKSFHFESNAQDNLMEFFVWAIKHYIADRREHVDIAVYSWFRNYRMLLNRKRGDDAALRKVNIGETLELNYNYDADGKRQLSDAEYQNRMHEDIRASLVANVYPDSTLITKRDVEMFEDFVDSARVGLDWAPAKKSAGPKTEALSEPVLQEILSERTELTRDELNRICATLGRGISPSSRVTVTQDGAQVVYRPVVQNSKRFSNVKGVRSVKVKRPAPAAASEPLAEVKTPKVALDLPPYFQNIFCDNASKVKREDKEHEWFTYAKDCFDLGVVETAETFYVQSPARCPYDWCTGGRKGVPHKSNNMICCLLKRTDRDETEMFGFCLDQSCRKAFIDSIKDLPSGHGICSMQSKALPSVYSKSDNRTDIQKYFMTPYKFSQLRDGGRRQKLLDILQKDPAQIRKIMSGDGPGRVHRNAYFEFLGNTGWVKICELLPTSFLPGR